MASLPEFKQFLKESPSLKAAVLDINRFLEDNSGDNSPFFVVLFPWILDNLFGYEVTAPAHSEVHHFSQFPGGWLRYASRRGHGQDAAAMVQFLSPSAPFFQNLLQIDSLHFIRHQIPADRLPYFARRLLSSDESVDVLFHQVPSCRASAYENSKGRYLNLGLFDYFFASFARFSQWESPAPDRDAQFLHLDPLLAPFRSLMSLAGSGRDVYTVLLHKYLDFFADSTAAAPPTLHQRILRSFPTSSPSWNLPPPPPLHQLPGGPRPSHAHRLVTVFARHWLLDNDTLPFPFPERKRAAVWKELGFVGLDPTLSPSLGRVRHLMAVLSHLLKSTDVLSVFSAPPPIFCICNKRLGVSESSTVSMAADGSIQLTTLHSSTLRKPPNAAMSLEDVQELFPSPLGPLSFPLFKFVSKSFQAWPLGSQMEEMSAVVDLWLMYLRPWQTEEYGAQWQGFVLANSPLYAALFVDFSSFLARYVRVDPRSALKLLSKVLSFFTASKSLLELLAAIEAFPQSGRLPDHCWQWSLFVLDQRQAGMVPRVNQDMKSALAALLKALKDVCGPLPRMEAMAFQSFGVSVGDSGRQLGEERVEPWMLLWHSPASVFNLRRLQLATLRWGALARLFWRRILLGVILIVGPLFLLGVLLNSSSSVHS